MSPREVGQILGTVLGPSLSFSPHLPHHLDLESSLHLYHLVQSIPLPLSMIPTKDSTAFLVFLRSPPSTTFLLQPNWSPMNQH